MGNALTERSAEGCRKRSSMCSQKSSNSTLGSGERLESQDPIRHRPKRRESTNLGKSIELTGVWRISIHGKRTIRGTEPKMSVFGYQRVNVTVLLHCFGV